MTNDTGTVNKVILVGEISHTPRWHRNENGIDGLCFTLTTRETFLQKGKQAEHIEEHSVRLNGTKKEHHLKLGQLVHIEGKIKTSFFTDEQGVRRYKTEVIATWVLPLSTVADADQLAITPGKSGPSK